MLNDQDIQKIINAQKDVFPSKTEFSDFNEEMRKPYCGKRIVGHDKGLSLVNKGSLLH